jgi:hypothetical protein
VHERGEVAGPTTGRPKSVVVYNAYSAADLATDECLSGSYDSRLMRLAWLAPDVLERLVVGRELSTISIYDLCFMASPPLDEHPGRVFE